MRQSNKESINTEKLSVKNEIIGIILLFISILMLFSFLSYSSADPSFFSETAKNITVKNYVGRVGAEISAFFMITFGYASYIIIVYILFIVSFFFMNRKIGNIITKSAGYMSLLISLSSLLANLFPYKDAQILKAGGVVGYFINSFFVVAIKPFFSFLLFFIIFSISLIIITKFSFRTVLNTLMLLLHKSFDVIKIMYFKQLERYKTKKRIEKVREKYNINPKEKIKKEKLRDVRAQAQKDDNKQNMKSGSSLFPEMEESFPESSDSYNLPLLSFLDAPSSSSEIDYNELEEKKKELELRLNEFRIKGEIKEYSPGPVITTYEFVPDTGVKVRDVTNLSEDLALVVRAQFIRVERVLGKKAIGIEIPNKRREIIHLREVLESNEYKQLKSPLAIGIGKTKDGEFYVTDLREMPHLIIAGATGSGKSVAIHTILLSILYKATPDEVKLILIDPKQVELAIYNTLPHLLTPVVVQTKMAKNALDWAVYEMEERYKKLSKIQVRNIDQYNARLKFLEQTDEDAFLDLENHEQLPYIVIVIDEFADLIMEVGKDIEHSVARIAQKARAVGIHLILATQRPSTDVITGTIKNNFPSRIALAVPSKFDSRTIIDVMGAEKLLGNGDMLFLPPKTATLIRLHCAFVSEEEAYRVVKHISKYKKPEFNNQILKPNVGTDKKEDDELTLDALFFDAAEIVIGSGQGSASFLQRRMSVGYARAGRLIDQLVKNGIISEANSKNQREILMTMSDMEHLKDAVNYHG